MNRLAALSIVLCSTPLACAVPTRSRQDVSSERSAVPAASLREAALDRATGATALPDAELALWRSASFRRAFTESYIAESDVEPRLATEERETMQEILQLISADRPEEAIERLRQQEGPSSAVFDFTLANLYFQQEDLDRAAASYERAVAKHSRFRRAWRNLGVIRVRQGEFERALPALTRVIELGGGDAITYGLAGFAWSNVGNPLSAETGYRMAMLLDPDTPDWTMGLARSLFEQNRHADVVALTDTLIAKDPDRADLWLLQANAYLALGEPQAAAENLELVDRLQASTPESLNLLGDIYVNEEVFDLAVRAYARAMRTDTRAEPVRWIRAAHALWARGAHEETRMLLERIDEVYGSTLEPEVEKELLGIRARLAVAEGAGDEEARILERIVELDPLDGEALILLGQHSARAGDPERAAFYYERAAGLEDQEADAMVRHAQLLVGQERYAEALPKLRRAQALDPRDNVQEYLEQVERAAHGR